MNNDSENLAQQPERRKHIRIEKHFIVTFFDADKPDADHNISQIKNISRGGLLFSSNFMYPQGHKLQLVIKTPYISANLKVKGIVLDCVEKIQNVIYEIRVQIVDLNIEAELILKKIEQSFLESKQNY